MRQTSYSIAIALILTGIVLMCQPFDVRLYALGFWTRRIFSATVDQFLSFLQYGYGSVCLLPLLADQGLPEQRTDPAHVGPQGRVPIGAVRHRREPGGGAGRVNWSGRVLLTGQVRGLRHGLNPRARS